MNAHPRRLKLPLLVLFAATVCSYSCATAAEPTTASPGIPFHVHPKVLGLVQGWLSDGESPIVTEINLDAVSASRNQFDPESVKTADGWTRCPDSHGSGFQRYRILEAKGQRWTVEYQENGGGSLTTASIIECSIENREIRKEGKLATIRVLRVLACRAK